MGRLLAIVWGVFAVLPVWSDAERVELSSFGHPAQAIVTDGQLTWNLPAGDGTASTGAVDWWGRTPTQLRHPQLVKLPDGRRAVALIGSRSGQDQLFLLVPKWGGAELWGGEAWLKLDSGQTAQNLQWKTMGDDTVAVLWSDQGARVRAGSAKKGWQTDSVSWEPATREVVRLWPWHDGDPTWALVAAVRSAAGWAPSVWVWSYGRLVAQPVATPDNALPDADVDMSVAPPTDSRFSVTLHQGSVLTTWRWLGGSVSTISTILAAQPMGSAVGRLGTPAFFWWNTDGKLSGQSTPQWGSVALVNWTVDLPGVPTWNSRVTNLGDRWRVWFVIPTTASIGLYRLEVSSSGVALLVKVGDLPLGTTALQMTFSKGAWHVQTTTRTWILDPDVPRLTSLASSEPRPGNGR